MGIAGGQRAPSLSRSSTSQSSGISSKAPPKVDIARLPVPNTDKIIGRDKEVEQLNQCWKDGIRIASIVAFGGIGKSSVVHEWLQRMDEDHWHGADRVYGWSFYRQGMNGGASSDEFFDDALKWFGEPNPPTALWEKGRRLAELVQKERTLLILDGIEPLQEKPQGPEAKIQDTALASLIRSLASGNSGLCVLTTRIKVAELKAKRPNIAHTLELDSLSNEAGAELLRARGADGTKAELQAASRDYKGHALALTLLGTYVREACDGQIARRHGLPSFEGEPAQRMMALYEQWFTGKPELSILRLLGLFDRPAPRDEIEELRRDPAIARLTEDVVPTCMLDPAWNTAVTRLRDVGLVAPKNADGTIDVHPLVREYLADKLRRENEDAWREGHRRLYEYLKNRAKPLPETRQEMAPLYAAVVHGCCAGMPQEVLHEVYWPRIQRGSMHWVTMRLGDFRSEVAILSAFFAPPWERIAEGVSHEDHAFLFGHAGYALLSVGRLHDAEMMIARGFLLECNLSNWRVASMSACNWSQALLSRGELGQALEYAQKSIDLAAKSNERMLILRYKTMTASILHAMGTSSDAVVLFTEAEQMQRILQPQYQLLYGLMGFQYCDFLLWQGHATEVQERAAKTLKWAVSENRDLMSIGLDHLTLGCTHLRMIPHGTGTDIDDARNHLDQAVVLLLRSGILPVTPLGLLARGALHIHTRAFADARIDLDEAMDIATHCGFRLHEADAHLGNARLGVAEGDLSTAREHLEKARKIIDETRYHRRDREVHELEEALSTST